ncbi:structural maintenance of chromosome protein 3 [Polychaeton citri CBS 116435]|uniref:Structural maintenance of chromosomes protein n=1 Tax=Polychaeton citri CBS 116435 TaxID=1314669 RepID=A0A9P4USQ5_9PEZI|nr:structural maintenance of chromosome protein 3 [Polychaeton citri CBS 116435]
MHIKQIIIQGFKSYKDQTVIEPFSPHHNVIVGRNGSGKSNFFAAIRFVLSDAYTQLGREERSALLHEGAGRAVMSAYVEIIFDNSDERFPTGTPEVILRRTIGQKKDEYSLNRKNTTKQEVMNMLENAGFSKSNPYYIVPQGRVTMLTNMKDAERLNMLKEVAGTQVYESRRAESIRIMEDSRNKRTKTDELLDHIRSRLDELEADKQELREYQEKDRDRRCLEFTIHRQEQEARQEALDRLNEEREGGLEQTDDHHSSLRESEQERDNIDTEIAELQQEMKLLHDDRIQLEEQRKETAQSKARVELSVQSTLQGQTAAQESRNLRDSMLQNVQAQIQDRETQLGSLLPQYNDARSQEKDLEDRYQDAEAARQRLYGKQNRRNQFSTKKDRDTWLRQQISDIHETLATRKSISMQTTEDIADLENQIQQLSQYISETRERMDNRGDESQSISIDYQNAKDEGSKLEDQRKELWRQDAKLDSLLKTARDELTKSEQFLSRMMDQNTSRGLENVRRLIRQHNIQGAYGTLGELFEFSEKYKTAIEVTAGMSLFHYVVDTEETAAKLVNLLQKERGGRVTFMPLNRLNPRPANVPNANDARHLLTKLRYNPLYEKAFQQVFGKTIVCPNLQVAAQYARSHGLNAITPEGDRSDRKGALTGGYHDPRSSRIDGLKRYKQARDEHDKYLLEYNNTKNGLDQISQQITKIKSELQKIEQRRLNLETGYGSQRQDLRAREHQLQSLQDELDKKRRSLENVEQMVRVFSEQLDGYEAELSSDFRNALSTQEEAELQNLEAQIPTIGQQLRQARSRRSELEMRKSTLELELKENLRPRLDELLAAEEEEDNGSAGAGSTRLQESQRDLQRISAALEQIESRLADNEAETEQAQQNLQQAQGNKQEKLKQIEDLNRLIANHKKSVQKAATKRALLSGQIQDVTKLIRDLGALPDVAWRDRYMKLDSNTATKRLHKVQEALKKYTHVNKKAVEQFTQFERQREVLEKRREELSSSDDSIRELITVLDQRKDEAIDRTFKQVSREFARIFERLVPAGKGRLIIQRRTDKQVRQAGEEEESEEEREQQAIVGGVESYTGVGISVSFNSKHDEQQRIQQLSGGQKSLCALALVFAIQASDPAPFYLFDEIDANLDAQYRTAVADLLKESARSGQFICTTFRPEMLLVADKCYGVSYIGKASGINVVTREDALDFVEGQIGGK